MDLIYSIELDNNVVNVYDLKYDDNLSNEKVENAILNFNFVERHIVDKKTLTEKLTISSEKLEKGDKIFLSPGVSIPRFKIRELGKEIGFDIVRNSEKANKIVISIPNFIKDVTTNLGTNYWQKEDFIKFYEQVGITVSSENKERYDTILEKLRLTDFKYVTTNWDIQYVIKNISRQICTFNMDRELAYNYFSVLKEESQKSLVDSLYQNTTTLIDDTIVIKQCSSDKVITHEIFQRINQMMKTPDNRDVALELMCNYDYEDSMFYILLLASKNDFSSFHAKNHVSYKNFRKYASNNWGVDPSYYVGRTVMDVLSVCFEHKKVTKEILSTHKNDILDWVKGRGESKLFSITGIALKEEYKEKLV